MAEKLWHFNGTVVKKAVESRLEAWRCRAHQRGLEAAPLFPGFCPTPSAREANQLAGSGLQMAPKEPETIVVFEKSTSGIWWLLLGLVSGLAVGIGLSKWKRVGNTSSNRMWAIIGSLFCAIVLLYALARASV